MTMQLNPTKVFKLDLSNENIEELIGKAKLIKAIINEIPKDEVIKNKDEFIAFSNELNELLEDIDEILMKRYIKLLDDLFEAVNAIIELISDKLGEYAVKDIIIKPANEKIDKEESFISLDEVYEALNEN
ncbi:hypothetical protein JCM11957_10740 [Caminibacter profundus]